MVASGRMAYPNPHRAVVLLALLTAAGAAAAEEAGSPVEGYEGLFPPVPERSPVPDDPVRVCHDGACAVMGRAEALADGYTLIDLSDGWAPRIFHDGLTPGGHPRTNSFRQRFVDLANDRCDHDGEPLERWEANYLELYGIPPAVSLFLRRWRKDRESLECYADVDFDRIASFAGRVLFRGQPTAWIERERRLGTQVKRLMRSKRVKTPDDLAALGEAEAKLVGDHLEARQRVEAVHNVQKRLKCDRIWSPFRKIRPGREDRFTQEAVAWFERKHRIFGYGHLRGDVLAALATPPEVLNHRGLLRVIAEHIVSATGIVEDGTGAGDRDLVAQYTEQLARDVGIDTPEHALAWFDRVVSFDHLWVGVRFPPPPPYYSDQMDLQITIDRGDVWYDFPFDEKGRRRRQKRARRPRVTVSVDHEGVRIPLVRWPTTVGSWRQERVEDGYVYLRYKGSDVGPRLLHKVIAAPVWIPPETTPLTELLKKKKPHKKARKREWMVNYDETGPGYKSAYGLVAGYLMEQRCRRDGSKCWEIDHGIRIHGSADYMSILARYSHGCHRLYNHLAIRLYGFVLAHRLHKVRGEGALEYEREFEVTPRGESAPMQFKMELGTRGFRYELDPPLPVEVLEGSIQGKTEEPIEEYMRIPEKEYGGDAWVPQEGGDGTPPPDAGVSDTGPDAGVAAPAAPAEPAPPPEPPEPPVPTGVAP